MLSTLLKRTDPARRRVGTAIVVGIIGGFFSAIVKFGWEVPFPWVAGGQTWAEHFSEALGHVIWLWSIELVRRDVRNRITHQPDPWVPLDAEPAR